MARERDPGYTIHVRFARTDAWFFPRVHDDDSIAEVKRELWQQALINPESQELIFAGNVLMDYNTVQKCGITADAYVLMQKRNASIPDFLGQSPVMTVAARSADLRFARTWMRPRARVEIVRPRCGSAEERKSASRQTVIPERAEAPSTAPLATLWDE